MQLLEKAKKTCLITNSMTGSTELQADVSVAAS